MEEQIKKYIKSEVEKLDNGEVEKVDLKGVYPSVIFDSLGGFEPSEMDTNGWQVDYWVSNSKYTIDGCMFYGTATITLTE